MGLIASRSRRSRHDSGLSSRSGSGSRAARRGVDLRELDHEAALQSYWYGHRQHYGHGGGGRSGSSRRHRNGVRVSGHSGHHSHGGSGHGTGYSGRGGYHDERLAGVTYVEYDASGQGYFGAAQDYDAVAQQACEQELDPAAYVQECDPTVLAQLQLAYGKYTQEVGYLTDGHQCVTQTDVDIATRVGGSLLYGEVLPAGVCKLLDEKHLNASSARSLVDLGMGTGKLALQAFLTYENLTSVVGVELCHSRYLIAEAALRRLAHSSKELSIVSLDQGRSISLGHGRRRLVFRAGNLFEAREAYTADVVVLETDLPPPLHPRLCELTASIRPGARLLTYINLRDVWSLPSLPLAQVPANVSAHDRFLTSWSFSHGHHFFVWTHTGDDSTVVAVRSATSAAAASATAAHKASRAVVPAREVATGVEAGDGAAPAERQSGRAQAAEGGESADGAGSDVSRPLERSGGASSPGSASSNSGARPAVSGNVVGPHRDAKWGGVAPVASEDSAGHGLPIADATADGFARGVAAAAADMVHSSAITAGAAHPNSIPEPPVTDATAERRGSSESAGSAGRGSSTGSGVTRSGSAAGSARATAADAGRGDDDGESVSTHSSSDGRGTASGGLSIRSGSSASARMTGSPAVDLAPLSRPRTISSSSPAASVDGGAASPTLATPVSGRGRSGNSSVGVADSDEVSDSVSDGIDSGASSDAGAASARSPHAGRTRVVVPGSVPLDTTHAREGAVLDDGNDSGPAVVKPRKHHRARAGKTAVVTPMSDDVAATTAHGGEVDAHGASRGNGPLRFLSSLVR